MSAPTCGRCGVHRHLHPTTTCEKSRRSHWWDEHYLHRHIAAWLWINATPSRLRWRFLEWMNRNPDRRDWCQLADCALQADQWRDEDHGGYRTLGYGHDYRSPYGCLCEFPLPWDAAPPRGQCYCPTPEQRAQMETQP
jgi:hypothetical protein